MLTIFVIIYLINNRSKNLVDNRDNLPDQEIKKDVQKFVVERVISESSTTKKASRSIQEEFVEIDGKQWRKIDWHDYEAIDRENARTGLFYYSEIDVLLVFFN